MKKCLLALLALTLSLFVDAQLVINEFMAGNFSTYQDSNGEYEDWIEIYNTSDASVSLNDFYITDNFSNKLKYKLPSKSTIASKGFLIIIADDNAGQGILHANFKLSLDGEEIAIYKLSGTDTTLIDSLTFGVQSNEISFGRFPDGNEYYEHFILPTPGTANSSSNLEGVAPMPDFSIPGGFYNSSQSVTISTELTGAQIRYTTDGSEPINTSPIYSTAISGDTTFILKAKVYADNYVPSKTQVSTYFINEHFCSYNESDRLPVVSISCHNDDLYGQSSGLLTNAYNEIEKMVNVELFEPNGGNVINQYSGLKVYGNATRAFDQKSLAAFARSKYGKGSFDYKFFDDKPFDEFESIVFRNGGSDWSLTYFRDALCQALVRNTMDIDAQGIKHAIMYLNGKFYGIIEIIEKVNEHYVEQNYNVNVENIDMLNHPSDGEEVICGDIIKYNEFKNYLVNSDMSNPILFSRLERMMDTKNFMNTQMAQIYIANIDMFLNSKYWRERVNYGKWRWIIYDTELSFGQGDYSYADDYGTIPSSNTLAFASESFGFSGWPYLRPWSSEKLLSILKNESFRNDFIQTFAVHINTTFKPLRVLNMIDSMQQRIRNEIPYQIETYGGREVTFNPYGNHFSTIDEWEYYVDTMRNFAIQRPDYMRSFIIDKFQLTGTYELTPAISNTDRGSIFVQGIRVPIDSTGIYFDNIPLKVKAVANEGYRFVKWEGVSGIDSLASEINVSLSEDITMKAIFEAEGDAMISEVFYKPSSENSEFIEIQNPRHATLIDLSKFSISGDINFTFPDSTLLLPGEYIAVVADTSLFSSPVPKVYQWTGGSLNDATGILVLKDSLNKTIDSVNYTNETPWPVITKNSSIELISSYLDNNIGNNWKACITHGGSAGIPPFSDDIESLVINEFMTNNWDIIADEKGECNDWIEILNPTDKDINFGGLYITNDLTKPAMYQIPVNTAEQTIIKPGEYKLLWADGETNEGALHLNFKLNDVSRAIGLSADGKNIFESVSFGAQSTNISMGRHADGTGDWIAFSTPTPEFKNSVAPEITSEPSLYCQTGATYEYNFTALDADGDDLFVSYYEKPSWATLISTGNGTATLSGQMPGGVTKVFNVKIFAFDGFTDPVVQEYKITRGVAPSGIINESLATNQFLCYPNPTRGIFNVALTTGSPTVELSIANVTGQVVLIRKLNCQNSEIDEMIDLSDQKKGIYYISIKAEEGTSTQKIILY